MKEKALFFVMGDQQRTPQEQLALLKSEKLCLHCGKHPYDKNNDCLAKSDQCQHLKSLCLNNEEDSNSSGTDSNVDDDTNSSGEECNISSEDNNTSAEQGEGNVSQFGHLSVQDSGSSSSTDGSVGTDDSSEDHVDDQDYCDDLDDDNYTNDDDSS